MKGAYIAVPDLDQGLIERGTRGNVHDTDVKYELNTLLVLTDVLAKELVVNIIGSLGDLRSGNASGLNYCQSHTYVYTTSPTF